MQVLLHSNLILPSSLFNNNTMSYILISQLVISLVILLIFINIKKGPTPTSDKLLIAYLVLQIVRICVRVISSEVGLLEVIPHTIYINQSTYLLDSIFIYLYVKSLKSERLFTLKTTLLFIPFIYFSYLSIKTASNFDRVSLFEFILEVRANVGKERERNLYESVYLLFVSVFNAIIYIFAYLKFKRNKSYFEKTNDIQTELNYQWQRKFIIAWFFLFFTPYVLNTINNFINSIYSSITNSYFTLSTLILIVIFGLKKLKIKYEGLKSIHEEVSFKQMVSPQSKYGSNKLTDSKMTELKSAIETLIKDETVLSDPEINLSRFAALLNEKSYLISQAINTLYNQKFQDFINTHRVNHAKELLKQNPEYKIIHVSIDCGYKSVATFNRQFKKITGVTPSEFKSNTPQ